MPLKRFIRLLESHSPKMTFGVSLCILCLYYWYSGAKLFISDDFTNNCVILFSTVAGFLFTALSIMISFPDKPSIKMMKSSNAYQGVLKYIHIAIKWSIFSLCIALLSAFFKDFSIVTYYNCLSLSVYFASIIAVVRILFLFNKVLFLISTEDKDD